MKFKTIDINRIKDEAVKNIALGVDKKVKPDGFLNYLEVSIFEMECANKGIDLNKADWYDGGFYIFESYGVSFLKKSKGENTENTSKVPDRKVRAKTIADTWAKTCRISDADGSFTAFVEKLYDVIKELNITKTDHGTFESDKYPTIEDQIVDEMLGIFAQESGIDNKNIATSKGIRYGGIFMLSERYGFPVLNNSGKFPKMHRLEDFTRLSRSQQLDCMVEIIKETRKPAYSNIPQSEAISPAQVHAMLGNPYKGRSPGLINQCINATDRQQAQRERYKKLEF